MQYFRLAPSSENPITGFLGSLWNKFMNYLAKRYAINEVKATGKSFYGFEMFQSIVVMSSVERDKVNKSMAEGKKMNIAVSLKYKVFHITLESVRKKNT